MFVNGEHIFQRERLKVEAVARVVIRRNRLRVAVHHDGFVVVFLEREGGMAAAIVELNSLPDAIGTAAKDDDLALGRGSRFVFLVVAGIEIGRHAFELCGAGVHEFEDRLDPHLLAQVTHDGDAIVGGLAPHFSDALVRDSHALHFT